MQSIPNAPISLLQLAREGRYPIKMGGSSSGFSVNQHPSVTANSTILTPNNIGVIPLGRAYVIMSGEVGCDITSIGTMADAGMGTQSVSGTAEVDYSGDTWTLSSLISNGAVRFGPFNGGLIMQEYHALQMGAIFPSTSGGFFSAHADVLDITNDMFFDAKYTVCVLGDSIGWTLPGTNGITANTSPKATGRDLYGMRIVERLRDKGASVRLVNKSYGSAQSASAYIREIDAGWIDFKYDLLIVELGMNDASANAGGGVYQSIMGTLITQAKRVNPDCSIVICGPSSTNDPSRQYKNIVAASTSGTAATASTVTLPTGSSAVDNFYNGNLVFVTATGNGSGQYGTVLSYVGSTRVATLTSNWGTTPTGTINVGVYDQTTSPLYVNNYRTMASNAVTAAGGSASRVYYCDLSTAYSNTGTDLSNYYGDYPGATGSGAVHANQAGHALLANVLATTIQSTDFYTRVLGLSGSF